MSQRLWMLDHVVLRGSRGARFETSRLEILAGRTSVVGASGAGKTSLLNLLAGFETPDEGRLEFLPARSSRLPLFWSPAEGGLWPHVSVADQLRSVAPAATVTRVAEELLDLFELQGAAGEHVDRLSAGERSRLCMARALAADADVLVLDEPLVHVDPARLPAFWDIVRRWCADRGTSLVFSSHHPETVLAQADQVICLQHGRVAWVGGIHNLYDAPETEQIGWSVGPVNWFEPDDARIWLEHETDASFGLRPERLRLESIEGGPTEAPPLIVASIVRSAGLGRVTLREALGRQRMFYVPAPPAGLQVGAKVLLRAMLACLVVLALQGCNSGSAAGPSLNVTGVESWILPNEGAKVPAGRGLHVPANGELLVLDDAGRLLVYDERHRLLHTWWMPEFTVGRPEGLWLMLDGRIAIADTHYHRVVFMRQDGTVESMMGEEGEGPGQFIFPETVIQDPQGRLYVCEYGGHDRVQRFAPDGTFEVEFGTFGTEPGQFQRPTGLVWWDHTIYVCDAINNRVQAFSEDGQFERVVADAQTAGLYYPYDMAASAEGDLYVVEFGAGRLTKLSRDGAVLGRFGSAGRGVGQFWTPWGVAVGRNQQVFVADTGNRRMVELRP